MTVKMIAGTTVATHTAPQPTEPQGLVPYGADPQPTGWGDYSGNAWLQMAYGGNQTPLNGADIETRLQRLERGQKFVRRGKVIPSLPQFRSQSYISQTSGNNPFVAHSISGAQFTSGQVPDRITPTTNNSQIRYPLSPTQL